MPEGSGLLSVENPFTQRERLHYQGGLRPLSVLRKFPVKGPPTMTESATLRARGNRNRGLAAERSTARYLREQGWRDAERAVRTGFRTADRKSDDPGDITGCPGLVISVKDAQVERTEQWLAELGDMQHDPRDKVGGLGILIVKRRGHASPGEWWAWLRLDDLCALLCGDTCTLSTSAPVRIAVSTLVALLHRAGYIREAVA